MDPTSVAAASPAARPPSRVLAALRAARPHQWAKNVLVFLPVLGAHRVSDPRALAQAGLAFVAFGLVASAVYVVNDLVDLEADRRHARKRNRPFASGALPVGAAFGLVPALLAAGAAAAIALPTAFALLLAGYFVATLGYSLAAKRWSLVDVLVLGGLYTSRVYAGGLATGIPVSEWLATFSLFLFVSLAFLKRASELLASEESPPGRGYVLADRESVFTMGTSAGYLSVLVLALYVSSPEVRRLYASPGWLWALCPLVLYWVSRLWLRARRGEVHEDPLLFALTDRATWVVAALGSAVVLAAARGSP
jgi:4-hydroxybenzoate polyprenyltransferase